MRLNRKNLAHQPPSGKEVQAMRVIMIGHKMYAAFKAWRKMRREELQMEYDLLVEMTLARSR